MAISTWDIDKVHSSIHFSVRHLMVSKVRGEFHDWAGTLSYDPDDITKSAIEVTIQTASVDTRDEKRDGHLKSADFLEVEKFPTITFKSAKVAKTSDGATLDGNLTIHGVTKPVTIAVETTQVVKDPWGGTRTGFSGTISINRKDFGLHWNAALETGGVLVGEKVEIHLELEAIHKPA
jgi:polyisoprenoid-binding protein YceI|nr:YceI family protein [Kofleriaceae bacterium]